jgi:hypothetical protein
MAAKALKKVRGRARLWGKRMRKVNQWNPPNRGQIANIRNP